MAFYSMLGCKLGRFNDVYCIIDFFGTQLVCHKTNEYDIVAQKGLYPRHFGIILQNTEYRYMASFVERLKIDLDHKEFTRFKDTPNEHTTFFIKDPSHNLIEFKYYKDERAI